jgi:hypothetical protein
MRIILILSAIAVLSCQSEKNETAKVDTEPAKTVEQKDNTEKIELLLGQFESLYNELLETKGEPGFKKFGFGKGGPYTEWLERVEKLEQSPESNLLLQKGVLFGELKQLGLEYVSSGGKETEVTKTFNKIFSEAINTLPTSPQESESVQAAPKSPRTYYETLQSDYELVGKWKIINSIINDGWTYEIYKKGSEYVGIIPEARWEFKIENLKKKGNNYYVKGNEYGEYYRIDANLNMTLFDNDGEWISTGYTAKKL